MSADLEDGYSRPSTAEGYDHGKVYVKNRSNGDVEVLTGPNKLTLGGSYQTIITLSKQDLLHLCAEAFKGEEFFDIISQLAKVAPQRDD